jgi:hypothetical protein
MSDKPDEQDPIAAAQAVQDDLIAREIERRTPTWRRQWESNKVARSRWELREWLDSKRADLVRNMLTGRKARR